MVSSLPTLALPDALSDAARTMAPAYLRRRLMSVGTPYRSGPTTTFVYVGDAKSVRVVHFMSRFPSIPPLERLEGTDLWHVTVELPRRSRVEYHLVVEFEDRVAQFADPLNTRSASDPFGTNSVAEGPGYSAPNWTTPGVDAAPGRVEALEIESAAFSQTRTLSVYLPADLPESGPHAAAVFHDGSDLLAYAALMTVLDNLIGAGAVRPLVGVLLDPVDRNREYMALPAHADFVVDDVLPHVVAEFGVSTDPADRIIAGASLGAVASLSTAWRKPGVFGGLLLCSGTFITAVGGPWNRSPGLEPVVDFMAEFAAKPGNPASQAWMACGKYEALAEDNEAFVPILEAASLGVHYEEPRDGHHWTSWRDNIGNGLRRLLPGLPAEV